MKGLVIIALTPLVILGFIAAVVYDGVMIGVTGGQLFIDSCFGIRSHAKKEDASKV